MAKPDPTEQLMEAADRIDKRREFLADFDKKTWKESELQEWRDEIGRNPDKALITLMALEGAIDKAKAEGRYVDDVTPWFSNIRAKLPPTQWAISQTEYTNIGQMAKYLDDEALRQRQAEYERTEKVSPYTDPRWQKVTDTKIAFGREGRYVEAPGETRQVPYNPPSWKDAAHKFLSGVMGTGAISKELGLGIIMRDSLPIWSTMRKTDPTPFATQAGDFTRFADEQDLAAIPGFDSMQRNRWFVLHRIWRLILTSYRQDPKMDLATIQARYPWQPGFHWEAWYNLDNWPVKERGRYAQETKAAQSWLDSKKAQLSAEITPKLGVALTQAHRAHIREQGWED